MQQAAQTKTPISATFELTPRCNLRCKMCYIRLSAEETAARGRERTADEWLALGAQAAEAGTLFLLLTGGEPLLRPDFAEIYRGLSRLGFSISINTNGTLLDARMLALFAELPPAAINITLYGASPADYAGLCGSGEAFDRVCSAIDALCAAKLPLFLNTTMTLCNAQTLDAIAAFANARSLPLRAVTYLFPPLRRGGEAMARLSPEDAGVLAARARMLTEDAAALSKAIAAIRAKLPDPDAGDDCLRGSLNGLRCAAGNCQYWVAWNGEMYPCGLLPKPVVYPFRDGLSAAWRQLTEACAAIPVSKQCGACAYRSYCPGCAAAANAETGQTDGVPAYICRLTDAYCRTLAAYEPEKDGREGNTGEETI